MQDRQLDLVCLANKSHTLISTILFHNGKILKNTITQIQTAKMKNKFSVKNNAQRNL